jgi:hypothetical protein
VSQVVLLILAVVWAIFLVPQVLRARAARSGDSVGAFAQQLSVLGRTSPAGSPNLMRQLPMVPPDDDDLGPSRLTLEQARKRRRDILRGLLVAMGVTLVLGLLPPLRRLLTLNVVLDLAFLAYVALLYRAQAMGAGRRSGGRRLRAPAVPRRRQQAADDEDDGDDGGGGGNEDDDTGTPLEPAGV